MENITVVITHNGVQNFPIVPSGITWELERKDSPGKLTFECIKDTNLNFQEGDNVQAFYGDKGFFYGFVFKKSRSKDGIIKVVAYDQLRYLKNKGSYTYENWTAAKLLKKVTTDYGMRWGNVENTVHPVTRSDDNSTLFDIIQNALDETVVATGKLYVMYDDFGYVTLKNINDMKVNIIIDADTASDYDYSSSIDDDTYNSVIVTYSADDVTKHYYASSAQNIKQWGVLLTTDTVDNPSLGQAKANALLKLHNAKTRNLKVQDAFGDIRVRAGSLVVVNLHLGDLVAQNYMFVERVTHKFENGLHTMDLTLTGGEFVA